VPFLFVKQHKNVSTKSALSKRPLQQVAYRVTDFPIFPFFDNTDKMAIFSLQIGKNCQKIVI
jgi:hypothetical protein